MDTLPPALQSLNEYPRWLVAACLTVVLAAALWLLIKVLKWTLYVALAVVLLGGAAAVIWLYWRT